MTLGLYNAKNTLYTKEYVGCVLSMCHLQRAGSWYLQISNKKYYFSNVHDYIYLKGLKLDIIKIT
jgi:hypothetical protein